MDHPVDIALRGIPPSDALERYIGEEARRLDGICDRIRSCQVVAEAQQREQPLGTQVAVRLIVTLPGTEVVVNREHGSDVYVACAMRSRRRAASSGIICAVATYNPAPAMGRRIRAGSRDADTKESCT